MSGLQWTTPRTWSVGDIATASMLNALRDQLTFIGNPPIARILQTAAQNCATAAYTAIAMDTSSLDTYSGHSNTVNNTRYTAQVPGYYRIAGIVGWAINSTGIRATSVGINGSPQIDSQVELSATTANTSAPAQLVAFLNLGDYVEMFGYQNSGGTLATGGGGFAGMTVELIHI